MGVGGGDGWTGGAVSGAVAPPGERAILRFFEDLVSIGGVAAAAGFAAQMSCAHPAAAAHVLCCCLCCWSALSEAAATMCCGMQLLLALACCCCCCCGSLAVPFPRGCCCCDRAAVVLRRLSLLICSFSARLLLGFLRGLLTPAAAAWVAGDAGGGGLLDRVKYSPSGCCSTMNRTF